MIETTCNSMQHPSKYYNKNMIYYCKPQEDDISVTLKV